MEQEWRTTITAPMVGPTHFDGRTYYREVFSSTSTTAITDDSSSTSSALSHPHPDPDLNPDCTPDPEHERELELEFLIRDSEDLVNAIKQTASSGTMNTHAHSQHTTDRSILFSILALSCGTVEQALRATSTSTWDRDGESDAGTFGSYLVSKNARRLLVSDIGVLLTNKKDAQANAHPARHVLILKADRGGTFALERRSETLNGPYPFELVVRPVESRRRDAHLHDYKDMHFVRSQLSRGMY